jgi:hypothetical protein
LVGPTALILSLITSIFVYLGTKNFSASFLTAVVGPFFFGWIAVTLLKKWLNSEEAPRLSIVSRVGGQVVNILWGSVVAFAVVAFLAFFPFDRFDLAGVSKDVRRSISFHLIKPVLIKKFGNYESAGNLSSCRTNLCSASPDDLEDLSADPQIQAIMNDPRLQNLINDPAVQQAAEKGDYRPILSSPVMRELSQDPEFLIKAIKAYPKIQQGLSKPSDQ